MNNRKGIISLITVLLVLIGFLALLNIYQVRGGQLQKANIYTSRENAEAEEEKFYTHPTRLSSQEANEFEPGGEEIKLNKNIKEKVFSKDKKKIAYHYFASPSDGPEGQAYGASNISISNPDGSDYKIIIKTRIQNIKLFWPSEDMISFYNSDEPSELFSLAISSQELTKLVGPLYNFSALWAPDGKSFVYSGSASPKEKTGLFWHNPGEQIYTDIEIGAIASGCAWSVDNNTMFCSDETGFWKIDVKNKTRESIYQNPSYIAKKMILPPLENHLIFKNKDGFWYSLPLKN